MKILMFGRGVISSMYGHTLECAGHTVEYYVRPGRAAECAPGLPVKILDARTKFAGVPVEGIWHFRLREDLPLNHDYDLIIVSLPHYRYDEAFKFLSARAGRATILVFGNFWTDPRVAAAGLPTEQLVWGFPSAGGGINRHGLLKGAFLRTVQFGTFQTAPTQRDLEVRNLFRECGFDVAEHHDFLGWLWIHFAIGAGLQAEVLKAGSFENLLLSGAHRKSAILNARELLPLVRARGVHIRLTDPQAALFRLPLGLGSMLFAMSLKLSRPMRAMIEGITANEEHRRTCRDVLAEARRLGVSVPRLERAESLFQA